ncbi:hypothetical protein HYV74_04875 [Candidatus Uhrbacteria bacterium]|nr:hypothetical protein [Candidatus Uhrbacteria bacterium]
MKKNRAFRERRIVRDATQAALLNIPATQAVTAYTVSQLGARPKTPPRPPAPNVAPLQQRLEQIQQELIKHWPPRPLAVVVGILILVEGISCSLLLDSMGIENPQRTVFGIMFAAVLIVLTHQTAELSRWNPGAQTVPPSPVVVFLRRHLIVIILIAYCLLVIAMTILRADEVRADAPDAPTTDSPMYGISAALVLMFLTAGIAWLVHLLMQRLTPGLQLLREEELCKRQIAHAEHAHRKACTTIDRLTAQAERWDADAEHLAAVYADRHLLVARALDQAHGTTGTTTALPVTTTTRAAGASPAVPAPSAAPSAPPATPPTAAPTPQMQGATP